MSCSLEDPDQGVFSVALDFGGNVSITDAAALLMAAAAGSLFDLVVAEGGEDVAALSDGSCTPVSVTVPIGEPTTLRFGFTAPLGGAGPPSNPAGYIYAVTWPGVLVNGNPVTTADTTVLVQYP